MTVRLRASEQQQTSQLVYSITLTRPSSSQTVNFIEVIPEETAVGASILRVTATDADKVIDYGTTDNQLENPKFGTAMVYVTVLRDLSPPHQIMYSIIASTSRTFFSNINPTNGEIRVKGDLFQTGVSVFEITIHARDNPGSNAVSRFDMATVTITVTRPVFTSATYNATISEYLPVQQSVIRTVATDADPANTPSGTIDYSIEYISSTLTNGFAQFLVSPTDGSIYISQPLTRINVPGCAAEGVTDMKRFPGTSGFATEGVTDMKGFPGTSGLATEGVTDMKGFLGTSGLATEGVTDMKRFPGTSGLATEGVTDMKRFPGTSSLATEGGTDKACSGDVRLVDRGRDRQSVHRPHILSFIISCS
ncbi:CELR-like protein [Mya arenaria]|uniref:CELR-like protein n=1 Tax=Mya arenaria TaxID=6604 RepID=A0ABY7EMD0_MYAAR|nr:CELR-like protein [Mya arenaria]